MKALVTGGAGFIGHHLVLALLGRGDDVVVLDDLSTGLPDRLVSVRDAVDLQVGDIRDAETVDRAVAGCELVFHQAALPSIVRSVEHPVRSTSVNVLGTAQVMASAGRHGVRRVVYAGSSSVYGRNPTLPRHEGLLPSPIAPYAAGKLAAEHLVHTIGTSAGVETVVLRYFNVYGPGQDPASRYAAVIPRFVTAALRGEALEVHGDGLQTRDFTFVGDVVAANLLAADAAASSGLTCNIGSGSRVTLIELIDLIADALGTRPTIRSVAPRPHDVHDSLADISLARAALGYAPSVPIASGIRRAVDWYAAGAPLTALGQVPAAAASDG